MIDCIPVFVIVDFQNAGPSEKSETQLCIQQSKYIANQKSSIKNVIHVTPIQGEPEGRLSRLYCLVCTLGQLIASVITNALKIIK